MTHLHASAARVLAIVLASVLAAPAFGHDGRGGQERGHVHADASPGPARVPAGVTVPAWDELTPAQRKYLGRLEKDWNTLPASQRVHALERAERRARWEAMPPEQRDRIRKGMAHYRDMTPEQRTRMRESMRIMRGLPPEERQALSDRWHKMSPEQRRAWLESGGPGISPPPDAGDD